MVLETEVNETSGCDPGPQMRWYEKTSLFLLICGLVLIPIQCALNSLQ